MSTLHHRAPHHRGEKTRHRSTRREHAIRGGAEQLERREMLSVTPETVASTLAHSAEHYAYQVDNLYQQYLGRGADAAGQQYWVAAIERGMTEELLAADFLGSAEYVADHGGQGAGWVSGMYQNLLGRTPDQAGLSYWVQQLHAGANATSVALGFATSPERETMQIASDYENLLGRAPNAAEVESWVSAFEHGVTNDDVAAGFVGSGEFLQKYGGNLVEFIDAAYDDLLGRLADPSAIEHWYETLHNPSTTDTAASQLTIAAPSTAVAGTPFSITVTVSDSSGNVATGYTGTVNFTSSDVRAGLPGSYTFTADDAGVHTFLVTLDKSGTTSISAYDRDSCLCGAADVVVSPASVSTLQIYEKAATVGVSHDVYVIARDAYGNIATSYDGTVHFSSSDTQAVLPPDSTISNGLGYFPVTMMNPGPQTITVTDTADSALTTTVNVTYAPPPTPPAPPPPPPAPAPSESYSISGPTSAAAGTALTYTVTVVDSNGNVVTDYAGTLKFYSTDKQAVLPTAYTFTSADAGVHTFSVTLNTAGPQTIYFIDSATTAIHGYVRVNVSGGTATDSYEISGPTSATAGAAQTFTVSVRDPYGNVVTDYAGTLKFSSTDEQAVLPADYTFTSSDAGVHTFSITLNTAGGQSIYFTDAANTGLHGYIRVNVAAAPTASYSISGPTSATAGAAQTYTVSVVDANGNVVTNYAGTLKFYSTDHQAVLPADYSFTSDDAGVHSFSVTLNTVGGQSLYFIDSANTSIHGYIRVNVTTSGSTG